MSPEVGQGTPGRAEEGGDVAATPDVHDAAVKITRAKEAYKAYARLEEEPTKGEVLGWCLYGLCSYFIQTVLIPIVFPLLISQIKGPVEVNSQKWETNTRGFNCLVKELNLYEELTRRKIRLNSLHLSALDWTSISWAMGLILAAPILTTVSAHLDRGPNHHLIAAAATATGALFCLPTGIFPTPSIFPPYIAAVSAAVTVCAAAHTRDLGPMVRGLTGPTVSRSQFPNRRSAAGRLSLYAVTAGSLGSAAVSAFTFHMLRHGDRFLSLWVVSIFSGIIWFAGIVPVFSHIRPNPPPNSTPKSKFLSIFKYPHAAGTLAAVFLSSLSTMSIFTGGILHLISQLCIKPQNLLYLWLTYFLSPLLSLPLVHLIKPNSVKMQILGFLLSALTAGMGFYHRSKNWQSGHVLAFTAAQGVAAGLLHGFGRVLAVDCSPVGREGTFGAWWAWARAAGTWAGFVVAVSGSHRNVGRAFGVAFWVVVVGVVVMVFGSVSDLEGAVAAGHVREERIENGSPVKGLDEGGEIEFGGESLEVAFEGKMKP
ncbi:hypothetical protein Acr_25g0010250 [Actinidia rufa]|uniref:Major facilitator superfamily protein n=1 Tax=Actinidia rufa TaxID=165716 RepID=A0A7J0H0N3_9ERIC|nr:hypothetical protein Acr_25g0010250 [Actinidia rufa]